MSDFGNSSKPEGISTASTIGAGLAPPVSPTASTSSHASGSSTAHSNGSASTPLMPPASQYTVRGSMPNTPFAVSVVSALLGGLIAGSLAFAGRPVLAALGADNWAWARSRLGIYGAAMGCFHMMEFLTTAGWNPKKLSVDAFLLNNTNQYHYAHAFGLTEYFISSYFFPQKYNSFISSTPYLLTAIVLLIGGQACRSLAMIHASQSFSHVVKAVKHDDHVLVTNGVYGWSRHPSYAGFFYWAVATQLLLGNIVSTLAFIVILGRFFSARIIDEEKHLIRFFGDDYIQYKKRVSTGLPPLFVSV